MKVETSSQVQDPFPRRTIHFLFSSNLFKSIIPADLSIVIGGSAIFGIAGGSSSERSSTPAVKFSSGNSASAVASIWGNSSVLASVWQLTRQIYVLNICKLFTTSFNSHKPNQISKHVLISKYILF